MHKLQYQIGEKKSALIGKKISSIPGILKTRRQKNFV